MTAVWGLMESPEEKERRLLAAVFALMDVICYMPMLREGYQTGLGVDLGNSMTGHARLQTTLGHIVN